MRNILIFGLSGNPPTGRYGHLGIVHHFSPLFDEIWLLPVYDHPYATKRDLLLPFHHRVAMLEKNVHNYRTI